MTPELARLNRARAVLGGYGETGGERFPSMFDDGIISFAHGEGVRRPHPSVVAAGVRALLDTKSSSLENYLFLQRVEALDGLATETFMRIGVPSTVARNVVVDAGTTKLFLGFLQLIGRPGAIYLTTPGFYHPLAAWCALHRSRLICIPTSPESSYKLTADDFSAWWQQNVETGRSPRPTALFLFNPSICGAVYMREELQDLSKVLIDHDLIALEDAIFAQTEFDGRSGPRLSAMPGMVDRVFTVTGGSKAHGMANIRIAWGCGPRSLTDRLDSYITSTAATIPQASKLMAAAALAAPKGYLEENRDECSQRVRLIKRLVDDLNDTLQEEFLLPSSALVSVEFEPRAAHSLLLSFDEVRGMRTPHGAVLNDSIDLVRYFLDSARVAFSPGLSMGWEGYRVRCTYGCVSTDATYPASQMAEFRLVFAQVAEYWRTSGFGGRDSIRMVDELTATFEGADQPLVFDFAAGRATIEQAFDERLLPALRRLCAANCQPRRALVEAAR